MQFSDSDIALLTWINHHLIPYSGPILQFISYTTTYASIALLLIVLIIAIIKKSKSLRTRFYILTLVLVLVAIVSLGLKRVIFRERPFTTYSFIDKLSEGGASSFPSGHTMEAFAMAAALSLLFSRKVVVIPAYLWAILVAYSRMALGVHYPSDVFAGIIIGTFIGWCIPSYFNRFNIFGNLNNPP